MFVIMMIFFACNNQTQTQKKCYSRDTARCILLYAFDEPCFDESNECDNYYRMIYQPSFDSAVVISIFPLDIQKAKVRIKYILTNELREDRLLKNYAEGKKGKYTVAEKEIIMPYVDTLRQMLTHTFFRQTEQEEWLDPSRYQIEMNQDGRFYSVWYNNPTEPNFLNVAAYFRKIAAN